MKGFSTPKRCCWCCPCFGTFLGRHTLNLAWRAGRWCLWRVRDASPVGPVASQLRRPEKGAEGRGSVIPRRGQDHPGRPWKPWNRSTDVDHLMAMPIQMLAARLQPWDPDSDARSALLGRCHPSRSMNHGQRQHASASQSDSWILKAYSLQPTAPTGPA